MEVLPRGLSYVGMGAPGINRVEMLGMQQHEGAGGSGGSGGRGAEWRITAYPLNIMKRKSALNALSLEATQISTFRASSRHSWSLNCEKLYFLSF